MHYCYDLQKEASILRTDPWKLTSLHEHALDLLTEMRVLVQFMESEGSATIYPWLPRMKALLDKIDLQALE